jgi:hypothetical protein
MSDAAWGEVVSAIALVLLSAALFFIRRKVSVVTATTVTYERPVVAGGGGASASGPIKVTLDKGAVIPPADADIVPAGTYRKRGVSIMRLLVIGADNRTSTSKTVALAWTYAIAFGLFAVLVAKWLGDGSGYESLISNGLREEYWLLLGGPYAAAIAAKYAATTQNDGAGKIPASIDGASPGQLLTDDQGNGDLGDFQYVLLNVVALAAYLGAFVPDLDSGLPQLPKVLTALALTSAGAYSAKKFLQQAPPTLTSILPASVPAGTDTQPSQIEVWGTNLTVPAALAPDGSALPPTVLVGGIVATVTAHQETLGSDHLTVTVPAGLPSNSHTKVTAVRADGVPATGPGGSEGLALTIAPQT